MFVALRLHYKACVLRLAEACFSSPLPHYCLPSTASIYSSYIARPTSYPGGPRAQKQKRRAAWLPRSSIFSPGWVFAEAETSVAVTEREVLTLLGEPVPLTGEAAGRQTWHWDPKKGKDLAGRKADYSFSAARNPNRSGLAPQIPEGGIFCVLFLNGGGGYDASISWLARIPRGVHGAHLRV